MDVICPIIGFLLIAIALVTLVGHSLWIFFSSLFGAFRSDRPRLPAAIGSVPNVVDSMQALEITRNEIFRLHRVGRIDDATCRSMLTAVEAERTRLMTFGTVTHTPLETPASAPTRPPTSPIAAPAQPEPLPVGQPPVEFDDRWCHPEVSAAAPKTERREELQPAGTTSPVAPAPKPKTEPSPLLTSIPPVEPPPSLPPAPPPPPRKPFAKVFAAFMEEKNIRWGELVGGMLIVLCSTALVVSLWSQIAAIPVLKFFVFTAVTASLFGAGLYTEHRWKLPTTSRGLLITASLLVPLTFLAISAFSEAGGTRESLALPAELVALGLFAALLVWSGRVIAPKWSLLIVIGVMGSSAGQLIIRRVASPACSTITLFLLVALPVLCYGGTVAWMISRAARWPEIDRPNANAIFSLLGILAFAAIVPFGLLLYKTGAVAETLQRLSLAVTVFGLPGTASGLLFWRKARQDGMGPVRTAGTSIGVAGAIVLLAGLVLAWPQPARLMPVSILDFLVLASLALLFEIPAAHLPAGLCLAVAYLLGLHLIGERIDWQAESAREVVSAVLSAASGSGLVPLVAVLVGAAGWLTKRGKRPHGAMYAAVSGLVAVLSLGLVSCYGLGHVDDHGAIWVYAIYAIGAFVIAGLLNQPVVTWLGAVLLLLAFVQGVVYRFGPGRSLPDAPLAWQLAFMLHATLIAIAGLFAKRLATRWNIDFRRMFAQPLRLTALIVSILAIVPLLQVLSIETSGVMSLRSFWLAAIWLALAWSYESRRLFAAFQTVLSLAVIFAVVDRISGHAWFTAALHPLWDPRSLQRVGLSLALLGLLWTAIRIALGRSSPALALEWRAKAKWLLCSSRITVDRVGVAISLVFLAGLTAYGLAPGLVEELPPGASAVDWPRDGFFASAASALGGGSWLLWTALLVTLAASLWEGFHRTVVVALVIAACAACPLLAGRFQSDASAASALRWYAAILWLAASAVLWFRHPIRRRLAPLRWLGMDEPQPGLLISLQWSLILLAVVPVLVLTSLRVALALAGQPAGGPADGSIFARMGNTFSYIVPLVLVSTGLAGHAFRERSTTYAFAAGLVVNLTATLAWLMTAVTAGRPIDALALIELIQLNILTAAAYALAWLSERQWLGRITPRAPQPVPFHLSVQVWIGLAGNILLIVPMTVWLIISPQSPSILMAAIGGPFGWIGFAAAMAGGIWLAVANRRACLPELLCLIALTVGSLIAFSASRGAVDAWRGYHVLLVAAAIVAWLMFAFMHPRLRTRLFGDGVAPADITVVPLFAPGLISAITRSIHMAGGLALLMAIRAVFGDPGRPWWSVGTIVALGILAGALARVTLLEAYLYLCGALCGLAATIWWLTEQWMPDPNRLPAAVIELIEVNLLAILVPAMYSLAISLRGMRLTTGTMVIAPFHRLAVVLCTVVIAVLVVIGIGADAASQPLDALPLLEWLVVAVAAVLAVASLWDAKIGPVGPLLYGLSLVGMGTALDIANLRPGWLAWYGTVLPAVFTLATNALWLMRDRCYAFAAVLRLPDRRGLQPATVTWLVPAGQFMTCSVLTLVTWVVLRLDSASVEFEESAVMGLRLVAALAVLVQAAAMGLIGHALNRSGLQRTALLLGAATAVAFGWAWIEPGGENDSLLHRAVIFMVALVAVLTLYGFALSKLRKRETTWTRAGETTLPWLLGACLLSLAFILGMEVLGQVLSDQVPMGYPAILAVLLALIGLACVSLTFALVPGRDPFKLSDAKRTVYVYAAEGLLALSFMHIRLTMPWLFTGFFERYWPLVVMVIAFVGVGLSELFRRQQRMVLAEPLERTGALLPMLPVLGFWALGGRAEVHYSIQLVIVGSLYAVLSIRRRSFGYGMLAALAGNGGLWYLLHTFDGLGLMQHPQLWFIPVAISILVGAQLNRRHLDAGQMAMFRYLGMAMIYLSSTIEIFLNGVREAPWLPLVLAGLSVAGVLLGIMLRIRSFLVLGSAFLLISLLTMIWHASANFGWTWLWYVAGIALGVAIIAVFALFEKRRDRMVRLVEDIKEWQA